MPKTCEFVTRQGGFRLQVERRLVISSFEDEALILDYLGGPDIIAKGYKSERGGGVSASGRPDDAVEHPPGGEGQQQRKVCHPRKPGKQGSEVSSEVCVSTSLMAPWF